MTELVAESWIYLVLALIVGLVVAWWIFVANRKTTIAREEGADGAVAGAAKRNQALIDAPPAGAELATPPPTPEGMAGASINAWLRFAAPATAPSAPSS